MDPSPIALTAATMIGTKLAEGVATELTQSLRSGLARLYRGVKARLQGGAEGSLVLERLEGKPDSSARILELAEVLTPEIEDPEFAQELEALVEDAKLEFVTLIQGDARVGTVVNANTLNLGGQAAQVAGGGGGGGGAIGEGARAGSGGAGGDQVVATFRADDLPESVSIVVGSGGRGGQDGDDGEDGGGSSFGDLLRAKGGKGGRGGRQPNRMSDAILTIRPVASPMWGDRRSE
jgi:hypothetical protein